MVRAKLAAMLGDESLAVEASVASVLGVIFLLPLLGSPGFWLAVGAILGITAGALVSGLVHPGNRAASEGRQ